MTRLNLASCAVISLAAACGGGTDVGNPVDVGVAAYDLTSAPAAPAANGRIEIDGVWVVITELALRPAADCEGDAEIRVTTPVLVDALGPIPSALQDFELPPGGYCRVEFKWDGVQAGLPGAPPELGAGSILVTGSRADGTRFVIRSERDDHLRLDARGGAFAIDTDTTALLIGVDALAWLAGIDLDTAVVGGDSVIHIDAQDNQPLLGLFDDNVADGAKLFEDQDGDSRLDPEEHDDTDVLADGMAE